jgi:parallel beta-helix repeat protein
MGAGGIKLDGAGLDRPIELRTGSNLISDNHIHDGGHVFHSAVGILLQNTFGNRIAHNHIHDLYYTGISCGWMWHDGEQVSRDNVIERNHVHHIGHGLLSDMGGVYILGTQPGTVIAGNLIHDIQAHGYGGWGIYLDQGSAEILVEGNVCYGASSHGFSQHAGRNNTIRNNIFAFNGSGQVIEHGLGPRPETEIAFTFERNILISDGRPFFVGGLHSTLDRRAFASDFNIFWDERERRFTSVDADNSRPRQKQRTYDFRLWQALGQDRHSIIADPLCRNPRRYDFTLDPDSPALALGFRPIDLAKVGPR